MSDPIVIDIEDYLESIGVVPTFADSIAHYGTPRKSGRYPYGSGGDDNIVAKRNKSFLDNVAMLKKQGLSEKEIAEGQGMSINQLRTAKSIAKNAEKQANVDMARRLADKGYSNGAIAERMGLAGESSVRALLAEGVKDKADILQTTANMLKDQVDSKGYIDVGTGSELHIGVSRQKLDTAIALLKEQGYELHNVQEDQIGTSNKTLIKVLAPPGTTYRDIVMNKDKINPITEFSEDGGRSYLSVKPPLSISSKRVGVRYREDGGADADGVIYVRPGVHDVSIGNARYAQVRIMVDGTHYLKGMAVYKDDLPDGVDLQFNTNKSPTGNKLDAMKSIKDDPENPFGATIRQRIDAATGKVTSAMNIVGSPNREGSGEEGSWDTWSRNLPSQFLSKQSPQLAKQQLDLTHERKRDELDDILRLTNPAVKRKLLESYADGADSSAVHLKAAQLPRQGTHVILPVNSLKENEIYAPNFNNGERVALVRFPHGGTFEIPELTVNNNHAPAIKLLGKQAKDAVGINAKVAGRLSGADFDGDTVLVIPNNSGRVKSQSPLKGLAGFDPQREYPPYDGMKAMDGGTYNAKTGKVEYAPGQKPSSRTKGREMGDISNLITDMTIRKASDDEIARAVRHSMVVIDAEKHALNYKESARQNGISALKEKYQGKKNAGASTLISRAGARTDIRARRAARAKEGGPIDKATGKKNWVETGESWVDAKGNVQYKTQRSTKLAEAEDAHTLSSGTKMEDIYAGHSNRMKSLANEARKAAVNTKPTPYSPSAKKAYATEVSALNAKLRLAQMNRPRERQAQLIANAALRTKMADNPHMDADQIKKEKFRQLDNARARTGAGKARIHITDDEWAAIQSGAITNSKLKEILDNADLERVKELATPKRDLLMTSSKTKKAETMTRLGYTQAEIAEALGVSVTTLKKTLNS